MHNQSSPCSRGHCQDGAAPAGDQAEERTKANMSTRGSQQDGPSPRTAMEMLAGSLTYTG